MTNQITACFRTLLGHKQAKMYKISRYNKKNGQYKDTKNQEVVETTNHNS